MNAIVEHKPTPGGRPLVQTRAMSDLIGRFTNRLEDTGNVSRKCISSPVAPNERERQMMQERKQDLLLALEPTPDAARKVLVALLASFPSYGEDQETARFILASCCRACAKAPTWALAEASSRFLEGRTRVRWDMDRRPTPPQILAEAMQCVLPVEAELHRLDQILGAEIVDSDTTDAQRQDALDSWAKLKSDIGRSNVISERTDEEITRERSEMGRANERFRDRAKAEAERKARIAQRENDEMTTGEAAWPISPR